LWYHAAPVDPEAPTRLEAWDADQGVLLQTWATGPHTKGMFPSQDGRFLALAYDHDLSSSLAAEVWYVGPEVLEGR
jgi:hypothetical protein